MAGNVSALTDSNFDAEILQSKTLAIVDFWAPWCGPCKSLAPVFEELSNEYAGKVKFAKVNIDDNPQSPNRYNVKAIPNLIFFKDGRVVDQLAGSAPKQNLKALIDKHLA